MLFFLYLLLYYCTQNSYVIHSDLVYNLQTQYYEFSTPQIFNKFLDCQQIVHFHDHTAINKWSLSVSIVSEKWMIKFPSSENHSSSIVWKVWLLSKTDSRDSILNGGCDIIDQVKKIYWLYWHISVLYWWTSALYWCVSKSCYLDCNMFNLKQWSWGSTGNIQGFLRVPEPTEQKSFNPFPIWMTF